MTENTLVDFCPLEKCPVEGPMRFITGRWRPWILYLLSHGPRRYSQLQKEIPKISARMLTHNLRKMEADGLIARLIIPASQVQVEYRLTNPGQELSVILSSLCKWGHNLIHSLQPAPIP